MTSMALRDQVSHQSKSPLYQQLYQLLRSKIFAGEWHPDEMLPSESELVAQYQVSRATVRQALDELASDGLIYRMQGRGTFVAPPTVEQGLVRIVSFTEDMQQRGFAASTKLISAELTHATESLARELQIGVGEPLARIERLRLADNEPMSVEVSFLVQSYCPGILTQDYTTHSLRRMLEDKYGIRITSASQTIQAITATPELADLLSISHNAALLAIERISYSEFGVPVEYLRLYHRGDRYSLHAELRG
ncbi:MAG: GntR family transcriptional regulator [Anaerolineae bacterium]|nr:GntR family transcriptional regulator [Anaerolineae bacterium]